MPNPCLDDPFYEPREPFDTYYRRLSKYGLRRFCRKIKVNARTGCWEWQGCKTADGYGKFHLGIPGSKQTALAHRVLYEHLNGPMEINHDLHHREICGNRACCKPAHLEPREANWHRRQHLMWCRRMNKAAERRERRKAAAA